MNYTKEVLYKSIRTGTYYKTPEEAEKSGLCSCGNEKKRHRIYCDNCEAVKQQEAANYEFKKFKNKSVKIWDDTVKMVYDENTDIWFHDGVEVTEHYSNEKLNVSDARLVEGVPNYLHEIETDIYEGDIHDEFNFSDKLLEALENLNEVAGKIIGCYLPEGCRIEL